MDWEKLKQAFPPEEFEIYAQLGISLPRLPLGGLFQTSSKNSKEEIDEVSIDKLIEEIDQKIAELEAIEKQEEKHGSAATEAGERGTRTGKWQDIDPAQYTNLRSYLAACIDEGNLLEKIREGDLPPEKIAAKYLNAQDGATLDLKDEVFLAELYIYWCIRLWEAGEKAIASCAGNVDGLYEHCRLSDLLKEQQDLCAFVDALYFALTGRQKAKKQSNKDILPAASLAFWGTLRAKSFGGEPAEIEKAYLKEYVQNRKKLPRSREEGFCRKLLRFIVDAFGGDSQFTKEIDEFYKKLDIPAGGKNALCAILAEELWRGDKYSAAIKAAKYGLALQQPEAIQHSFNILGCSGIDAKKWQLAYDAYASWLDRTMTGELKNIPVQFTAAEKAWRKSREGKAAQAAMQNNFAYLCAEVGDRFEVGSREWEALYHVAETEFKHAVDVSEQNFGYQVSCGTVLWNQCRFRDAFTQYKKAAEIAKKAGTLQNQVEALRACVDLCPSAILAPYLTGAPEPETFKTGFWENCDAKQLFADYERFLREYRAGLETLKTRPTIGGDKERREELAKGKGHAYLFRLSDAMQELQTQATENDAKQVRRAERLLLLINAAADRITDGLRKQAYDPIELDMRGWDGNHRLAYRPDEEPIAYYTTLRTVQFLFKPMYQPDPACAPTTEAPADAGKEGKNCLTMMHAMYMNDPNEGLTLLQALQDGIDAGEGRDVLFDGMPAADFRQELYDQNYVFLKAFTNRVDLLDMWAMYASDRQSGKDSNGCCVCIAPETFSRAKEDAEKEKAGGGDAKAELSIAGGNDDFNLYRVVYLNEHGEIDKARNPKLPESVPPCYACLKALTVELNDTLREIQDETVRERAVEAARRFLQASLRKLTFLFKEDAYFLEEELRLLVSRPVRDDAQVAKLPTDPPKLCFYPFFRVYIEKLILGPKVEAPDNWIPYFQRELNKMRYNGVPQQVVVRKSRIHYRD